jgi:hypothetical protein
MQYEDWDIPEYYPCKYTFKDGLTKQNPLGGNPRQESIQQLQEQYKKEYEKLKLYSSFDRTLREIESLDEITTDFGD